MNSFCGTRDECTSNPCGDKKNIKYRHKYGCSEITQPSVPCAVFGYSCDGVCSFCSDYKESEYLGCC